MEQKRGISITSTVLQFPYRDHVLNLLDTPGHRDFSEDTYRVLAAADAAIMVLDAAKGIEPQTLKLFEVCRERGLPLLTFINKWDRPGPGAARAARPDRAPAVDRAGAGHLAGRHRRRLPRRGRPARRPLRALHPHRARRHRGRRGGARPARRRRPPKATRGARRPTSSSCSTTPHGLDDDRFRKGEVTPGVLRVGAHELRRAAAPRRGRRPGAVAPAPRRHVRRAARSLDAPFSGLRVQGAGEHGPEPPRPHRVRAGVLGPVRARDGRHPRTHRASRSPPSTPTRCSGRSATRSRRRGPATWSAW